MPQSSGLDRSQSRATHAPAGVAQIATSNRTLNAFLGGPRPAWMTGASSSSEPTVNHGNSTVNQSNPTVVRSTIRAKKNRPSTYLRRESNPIVQPIEKPDSVEAQAQRNRTSILPSPAPTDEPSPVVSVQQESPRQIIGDHAQVGEDTSAPLDISETSREVATETAVSDFGLARQAMEAMYRDQVTLPPATNTAPAETRPLDGVLDQGLAQGRAQVATQSHSSTPPTNQLGIFQQQQQQQQQQPNSRVENTRRPPEPAGNSEPPSKRARTDASNQSAQQGSRGLVSPTIQWLEALNNRVAQHSTTLQQYCERPRYQCLHEALMKNDLFYVALHQVFCLGSIDRPHVYTLFSYTLSERTVDTAFEILQSVLRPNDQISSEHLQWFSHFPSPISDLISNLRPYSCALADVAQFLKSMAQSWASTIQGVKARNFPLLTSELLGMFKCVSPSLQTMLFTVSRRNLMVQDGPHAASLNALFTRNQAFESYAAARKLSMEEVEPGRQDFAAQFAHIVREAQAQDSRQNPAFSPQMVPTAVAQHRRSSTHSQPSPSPALPQRLPPPVAQQVGSPLVHPLPPRPQTVPQQATSPTYPQQAGYPNGPLPSPGAVLHTQLPVQQGSTMLRQVPGLPSSRPPHNQASQVNHLPQPHPVPSTGSLPGMPRRAIGVQSRSHHSPVVHGSAPQALPSPGLPYPQHPVAPTRRFSTAVPGHAAPPVNHEQWAMRAATGPQFTPEASNTNYIVHLNPDTAPPRQSPNQAPLFGIGRIPPNNYPPSPYDQASVEIGLHHRGRSPRREPLESTNSRFYQFVKECAVKPIEIEPRMGLRTLSFNVSAGDVARLARKNGTLAFPELPHSHFTEGSLRYRLRLCMRPSPDTEPTESLWALSAAHWPDHIVIEFNGTPMELQRKQHFHKDLPLELTNSIRTGENRARISLPLIPHNKKQGFKYFIGVDVVETRSHAWLLYDVHNKQHVMEEETKEELRRRLKPSDSDDMIIENQTLSVSLADPFSSSIFVVPVKGKDCKHLECFDLETWLNTRPGKPKQKKWGRSTGQEPSMVDVWKCPICDLDARPASLRINDFFVRVRKELTDRNLLNTKAILVDADGKWSPVEEPDDSDDDTPAPSDLPARARRSSRVVSTPEVIEILDD